MANYKAHEVFAAIISGIGKGLLMQEQRQQALNAPGEAQPDPAIEFLKDMAKTEGPYQAQAIEQLNQKLGLNLDLSKVPAADGVTDIDRVINVATGKTPEGDKLGRQRIIEPPTFGQTVPAPQGLALPSQPGMEVPLNVPPQAPSPISGFTRQPNIQERRLAFEREVRDAKVPQVQAERIAKETGLQQGTDYRDIDFREAQSIYERYIRADMKEEAESFNQNWTAANPGIKERLVAPEKKESGILRDTRLAQSKLVGEQVKDIIENDVRLQQPGDNPLRKKVQWLRNFQSRLLREKYDGELVRQADWDIFTGAKEPPWGDIEEWWRKLNEE